MRIAVNEKIAGYPALQIRQLMRKTVSRSITVRYVRQILNCSNFGAARVLSRLKKAGFVQFRPASGDWETTTKGKALAMATTAPALRRETAERLVADIVHRARLINADDSWAYCVRILIVFGSYARGVDRPNDVDIACELRPRWSGEQRGKEQERRDKRGERFRNISEWATWPRVEVLRYLKARARGLSIHELEDWISSSEHRVIFEDNGSGGDLKSQCWNTSFSHC